MAKNNDYGTIDKMLLYVTLVLLAIGLVMVFSASSYDAMISYKDAMFFFKRQLVWAAAGIVAMIFMMVIPVELVKKLVAPAARELRKTSVVDLSQSMPIRLQSFPQVNHGRNHRCFC